MSKQKCAVCGTPFEAHRNKIYCSKECAVRAAEETRIRRLRERGSYVVGDIITCPVCGKNFMFSSGGKKYCSAECQRKARKLGISKATPMSPRKKRPSTLAEVERKSREEGMSYGEYVVKYGI